MHSRSSRPIFKTRFYLEYSPKPQIRNSLLKAILFLWLHGINIIFFYELICKFKILLKMYKFLSGLNFIYLKRVGSFYYSQCLNGSFVFWTFHQIFFSRFIVYIGLQIYFHSNILWIIFLVNICQNSLDSILAKTKFQPLKI